MTGKREKNFLFLRHMTPKPLSATSLIACLVEESKVKPSFSRPDGITIVCNPKLAVLLHNVYIDMVVISV